MTYNVSYDVCAIIILVIVIVVHLMKKSTPLLQNNIFLLLAFCGLLSAGMEIFNVWAESYLQRNVINEVSCSALVLFQSVGVFLYGFYARTLVKNTWKNAKLVEKLIFIVPILTCLVLIAINPITKILFYYNSAGEYCRGPFLFMIYSLDMVYVAVCLYYMNIYRAAIGKKFSMVPMAAMTMAFVGVFIQMLFPRFLILNYMTAVSIVLFMLTIQKPEESLDPVMGVFNNKTFSKIFEVKKQTGSQYYTLLLYVEDTKLLNQALGLDNMNQIMHKIALFLEEFVKRGVYYLGSNVFVLMLENDSYKEVTEIMQKIDRRFEEKWEGTGSSIYITVRMMKLMFPKEVKDLQTFYTYVDYMKELDNSKKWILNATDVSLKDNNRRIVVETAVKDAIRNDGFQVFYQPIYSVDERKIQSAEALVRLSDPVIGPISPAEFIPIAERNGTILKIGIIVFEKVCKFISENNLRDKGIEYVEINLSVVQCMQENMGDELLDIMKKYHLESSRINLEVTETAAISSPKMLVKNMHHLFDHGVRFSLDDFGTGYSNISSLANLPLDMIKFDKVMVDSLVKADRGKMLLISSIAMVKRMNLKIVAEGVEERAQAETLIQMGVDYIQGYYFERPIPGKEFLAFVEQFQIENYLS